MQQTDKDNYKSLINFIDDKKEKQLLRIIDFRIMNLKHIRSFLKHLTTITFVIIGIFIPIVLAKNFINNYVLAVSSILILIFVSLKTTYFLFNVLSKENNKLEEQQNFYNKTLSNASNKVYEFFTKDKPFSEAFKLFEDLQGKNRKEELKLNEKSDNNKWPKILVILFMVGIIFMLLSFVDFENFFEVIYNGFFIAFS